ncbi:MAG: hypothetical protein ACJAS2_002038, partial [Pseudohongiellaceae bacterium]
WAEVLNDYVSIGYKSLDQCLSRGAFKIYSDASLARIEMSKGPRDAIDSSGNVACTDGFYFNDLGTTI